MKKYFILTLILALSLIYCFGANTKNTNQLYKQHVEENIFLNGRQTGSIEGFTYEELVTLSKTSNPTGALKQKLDNHLSKVFIFNQNYDAKLEKKYVTIAQWNIKRGTNINVIKEIFVNPEKYKAKKLKEIKTRNRKNFIEELNTLSSSDIICLNEADIGMPRTNYKNIVSDITRPLNLNYAYATEFVEVGPIFQRIKVDKDNYKGLHGNVIISKFPIISANVIRLPSFYDWYNEEVKKKQSPLEHLRKFGAKVIFSQHLEHKEVRHGNRNAIVADIQLPNNEIITVVITHFEDRAYPDWRLKQFQHLLKNIKNKNTPLVLAGDFNTSTTDTMPTSVEKEIYKRIRDPHFLLRQAAFIPVPFVPIAGGLVAVAFSKLLQYKDPFFPNIPIIFPNHERKFFTYLKKFKFNDRYGFDLSGDKKRSSNGRKGLLANSNQRHWKGFKSTFKLEKPRIIAYFKLDWFFIKPVGSHFLPFNGRTLKTLNYSLKGLISDHNPITVDLRL